jgi:AcrR family transcriptional regulator
MSPRTSAQFIKIRHEKKALIMEKALELFAGTGYHATSISQIAKKAEISKGLIYNYFESKKEILDELITTGFITIFQQFDTDKDGVLTEEEFIHFIKMNFILLRENIKHWKLFYSLMLQPQVTETFTTDYQKMVTPLFDVLYNFIKSKGSNDPDGDLMVISAMIEGAFLYAVAAPGIFNMDVMEEKIITACFKIIKN